MSELRSTPEALAEAEASNCDVIYPTGFDCLMLDLDGVAGMDLFLWRKNFTLSSLERLGHSVAIPTVDGWISRSGSGMHLMIALGKPLESLVECVSYQGLLGSDFSRDGFTLERWRAARKDDRMLFRPKGAEIFKGLKEIGRQIAALKMTAALKGEGGVNVFRI